MRSLLRVSIEGVDDDILSLLQKWVISHGPVGRAGGKEVEYIFSGEGGGGLIWDFQKQTELFPNPVVFMSCIHLL
jgi:hypothetical protein